LPFVVRGLVAPVVEGAGRYGEGGNVRDALFCMVLWVWQSYRETQRPYQVFCSLSEWQLASV
jgi:hypothetical protein